MDSSKEKAFLVHLLDKIVRLKQISNNLHGMDSSDPANYVLKHKNNNEKVQFAGVRENMVKSEVESNLKHVSKRQQKCAKLARKTH